MQGRKYKEVERVVMSFDTSTSISSTNGLRDTGSVGISLAF